MKYVALWVVVTLVVFVVAWFHWVGECEAAGGTVRGNIVSNAKCARAQ
jgi:hypothetical protein